MFLLTQQLTELRDFLMESGELLPPLISLLLLTVVYVADLTPCWCSSIPSALVQNVLKML